MYQKNNLGLEQTMPVASNVIVCFYLPIC